MMTRMMMSTSGRRRKPRSGDIWSWTNTGSKVHVGLQGNAPVILPDVTTWLILQVNGDDITALCVDKPGYVPRSYSCKYDFMGRSEFARGWALVSDPCMEQAD